MIGQNGILTARECLLDVTPLKGDCGRRCGAACCRPDEEGQGGMILFPGEETLYTPTPEWAVITESRFTVSGKPLSLLTCEGRCERGNRPLSCRIFPLTPVLGPEGVGVTLDVRAWPVCPLLAYGQKALSPVFIQAVRAAMDILWEDARCREYIIQLTELLKSYQTFGNH